MKCPNCGAEVRGNTCEFCGSELPKREGNTTINKTNNYYAGSTNEKSKTTSTSPSNNKTRKKNTMIWWILGWICIFPIPLTIILIRKKTMKPVVKYGIIIVAWLLYLLIAIAGGSSDDKASTTPNSQESNDITIEQTDKTEKESVDVSDGKSLEDFLVKISSETTQEDVKALAKDMGLNQHSKNSGTGQVTYRVAIDKDVADSYDPKKGSVIKLTFDRMGEKKLVEVTYFNMEKMVEGIWKDDTYHLTDYNNPRPEFMNMEITSFAEMVSYMPSIQTSNNALEELFLSINESTTKADIMAFVDGKGLHYNSRGMGNYEYITYDRNVMEKYGDMGSYLIVDFSEDKLTKMEYCDYPVQYKAGKCAVFFADYPYSDVNGFFMESTEGNIEYDSASKLLSDLQALR